LTDYLNLLSLGIVDPVGIPMEIYTTDIDGSNQKKITNLGFSSFAPYFLPKDDGIIFSSDLSNKGDFQLYAVSLTPPNKIVQITKNGVFNSFPMFSRDGKKFIWISNRDGGSNWGSIDVYIADFNDNIDYDADEFNKNGDTSSWKTMILIVSMVIIGFLTVGIFFIATFSYLYKKYFSNIIQKSNPPKSVESENTEFLEEL